MDRKQHWEHIYTTKASDSVSWFQEHADQSLRLIRNTGLGKDAAIIDVGGGASRLVDDLAAEGYTDLTVLDLSPAALAVARQRLGKHADGVHWIEGDIIRAEFPAYRFDIWHDRAVFHFLTDPADRHAYVGRVMRAVRPGGHVIVATFAEDGPDKCSGLPVMRYQPETLHAEFGDAFLLVEHEKEAHHTPFGTVQQFVYCYCRKVPASICRAVPGRRRAGKKNLQPCSIGASLINIWNQTPANQTEKALPPIARRKSS